MLLTIKKIFCKLPIFIRMELYPVVFMPSVYFSSIVLAVCKNALRFSVKLRGKNFHAWVQNRYDMSKFDSSNEKLSRSFALSFPYTRFSLLFPYIFVFSNHKTRLIEAVLVEVKLFMYKKLVSQNTRFLKITSEPSNFLSVSFLRWKRIYNSWLLIPYIFLH